jgi:hypothetical protein
MSVSAIASSGDAFSTTQVGDSVQSSVLKKAMEVQAQAVLDLVNAVPQPVSNLPAHLGQHINTTA